MAPGKREKRGVGHEGSSLLYPCSLALVGGRMRSRGTRLARDIADRRLRRGSDGPAAPQA